MIIVLDSRGCRTGYVSPSRAAFEVARGRARWCHHPDFAPDLRKGTIQRFQAIPLPPSERAQDVLLLDVRGVPLAMGLQPAAARELLDHPERWASRAQQGLVVLVGELRDGRWPRCLMLSYELTPVQLQELLQAEAAMVVDHAASLRTLLETLERVGRERYASCDLTRSQLAGVLRLIQEAGYLWAGSPPGADLDALLKGLTETALAPYRDDALRRVYAQAALLSRLAAQPNAIVSGLAGLRADLAAMTEAEAAEIVAKTDPVLHAVWQQATRPSGPAGGPVPDPGRRRRPRSARGAAPALARRAPNMR